MTELNGYVEAAPHDALALPWSTLIAHLELQCDGVHSGARHTATTLLVEAGCCEAVELEALVWQAHVPLQRQSYMSRLLGLCDNLHEYPALHTWSATRLWQADAATLRDHRPSPAELAQTAAKQLDERIRDTRIDYDMTPYTLLDKCRKCQQHSLKAIFSTRRSGDEGAVQTILCMNPACK